MSEFAEKNANGGRNFRRYLLCTVSAASLAITGTSAVADEDKDRPSIWIELGGQFERVQSDEQGFSPPFFSKASPFVLEPMVEAQLPPHYSIGGEGKLTFAPSDSSWVFSASVRYGRSNAARHLHRETAHPVVPITFGGLHDDFTVFEFGDGLSRLSASHAILDFTAGKDVGLGMFGAGSSSVISAGVRFAQFTSGSHVTLHARPIYGSLPAYGVPGKYSVHSRFLQNNTALFDIRRDSNSVGPSLAWNASVPVVNGSSGMTVAVDWGANAAVLFGRQRVHVNHQTSGSYFKGILAGIYDGFELVSHYAHGPYDDDRARTVTIPNVGGFAGLTFEYADAKVAFGYRADFFFNAVDGGIDTRKSSMTGFYGPFASVSVGIGG